MIGEPPSSATLTLIETCALPGSILVICGAEGGAAGVNGALSSEYGLAPTAFVAVAKQAYGYPLVSPETVMGEVELLTMEESEMVLRHKAV